MKYGSGYIFKELKNTICSKGGIISASIGGLFVYSMVSNGEIATIASMITECAEVEPGYSINLTLGSNMSPFLFAGLSPAAIMINQRSRENNGLRKERSRWEIIEDMLIVLMEEKKPKKTRIMQRAYLDWRNFQRYLDFLLEEGFMAKCNSPEDEGCYEQTEKGRELLKRLKNVKDILH